MLEALAARLAEAEAMNANQLLMLRQADKRGDDLKARAEAAEAERDALRAEVERLKTANGAATVLLNAARKAQGKTFGELSEDEKRVNFIVIASGPEIVDLAGHDKGE